VRRTYEGAIVGILYYGNGSDPIEIPERLLAHIKVVITAKLRRNERFMVSWTHPDGESPGRTSIWMDSSIPLRFVFDTAESEALDPQLLRELADEASSSRGLVLEPSEMNHPHLVGISSAA
jgi:hypothetical protein